MIDPVVSLTESNQNKIVEPKITIGVGSDFPRDTECSDLIVKGEIAQSINFVR